MKNVLHALRLRKVQPIAVTALVAGAAAIAATVPAVAASASPSNVTRPAAVHRCTTADLRVWIGPGADGTLGPIYYLLDFSNISKSACTLYGYPGVSAVGRHGEQLGSPASRYAFPVDPRPEPERLITLRAHATAHAALGLTDPGFYDPSKCPPAHAIGLRVYPPNDFGSTIVRFPFDACGKPGPTFMTVGYVIAGPGRLES